MIYRLYCSSGNTVGVDEFAHFWEIDDDGYWARSIEINANGIALRYTTDHAADRFGILPEGTWDEREARKKEYGTVVAISAELFETVWTSTSCANDALHP